jgi:hypothetical protein
MLLGQNSTRETAMKVQLRCSCRPSRLEVDGEIGVTLHVKMLYLPRRHAATKGDGKTWIEAWSKLSIPHLRRLHMLYNLKVRKAEEFRLV